MKKEQYKLNRTIADNIIKLREIHKTSRNKLAEDMGIDYKSLSKYECAKASISVYNLLKISKYFNVPISYMIENEK